MKKPLFIMAIFMAISLASYAQGRVSIDVILGRRTPNYAEARLMHQEENRHPSIATAMRKIHHSLEALQTASNDFGGHRAEAMADLQKAYESLRQALYYRLYNGG